MLAGAIPYSIVKMDLIQPQVNKAFKIYHVGRAQLLSTFALPRMILIQRTDLVESEKAS